jgi:prepilin peptidase CpaA
MNDFNLLILCGLLLAATVTDFSRHRIPNLVTLGGMGLGLLLQTLGAGTSGLLTALGGVAVAFAVFVIPYGLRVMAAGDVKLMMMVGAFLGWHQTLEAALITFITGGVMGIGYLAVRGGLAAWLHRYGTMLFALAARRPSYVAPRQDEAASAPFPYAIAILTGTLITLLRAQSW